MEREEAEAIVCSFLSKKKPLRHRTRQEFVSADVPYRIRPDEQFDFEGGHLLVELEATRRPVESVAKYWWLFHRTDYARTGKKMALVFVVLDPFIQPVRSETIELLGGRLEEEQPNLFHFFFVSPESATVAELRRVLADALSAIGR